MAPARILRPIPPIPALAKRSTIDSDIEASEDAKLLAGSLVAEHLLSSRRSLPPPLPVAEDIDEHDGPSIEEPEEL
jgi:hypothetical protein